MEPLISRADGFSPSNLAAMVLQPWREILGRASLMPSFGVVWRLVAVAAVVLMAAILPSRAEKRVALVVGNSAYKNTLALQNPVNDAEDVAKALRAVGFEVILERNLTKGGMEGAIARFARLSQGADTALVFYAGHGIQYRGQNFMMPIDAKLEDEFVLNFELNKVDDLMVGLDRARGVKILILDACRNNPLAERLSRSVGTRDFILSRGLAKIEPTRGMVIAYSTQANQVALDGDGRNSPFVRALVKEIEEPGLEIGALFRRVARAVDAETGGRQLPELSVSLIGDFYLNTRETDLQAWGRIRASVDSRDFRDFIRVHPRSVFLPDARRQLDIIERAERALVEQENARREQERIAQEKARQEAEARAEQENAAREQARREADARAEQERKRLAEEQAKAARDEQVRVQAERERLAAEKIKQETREQKVERAPPALESEPRVVSNESTRENSSGAKAEAQVAILMPPATAPAAQTLAGGALIVEIKKELKRVGCYTGPVDDKWATARSAAGRFARFAKLGSTPSQPGNDLLDAIRGKADGVCPIECGARETLQGGRCVAKNCPRGQTLDDDGRCKTRGEPRNEPRSVSASPDAKPDRQQAKGGAAGKCSEFAEPVRCRCAVQVGGWVSDDDWSPGGNRDAFMRCLIARGIQ